LFTPRHRWITWVVALSGIAILAAVIISGYVVQKRIDAEKEADFRRRHLKREDIWKDCAPDQLVEFVLGSPGEVSPGVYLSAHSGAALPGFIEVPEPISGCPTLPLKVTELFFTHPPGLEIPNGLHLWDIRIGYHVSREDERRINLCPGDPSPPAQQIEERTPPYIRDHFPDARWYCFHDKDAMSTTDYSRNASCGGSAGPQRECDAYQSIDGLDVHYILYQTAFPVPDHDNTTSTDPGTESGALLLFHRRLRDWAHRLARKP
jgi:hypothetical protein